MAYLADYPIIESGKTSQSEAVFRLPHICRPTYIPRPPHFPIQSRWCLTGYGCRSHLRSPISGLMVPGKSRTGVHNSK